MGTTSAKLLGIASAPLAAPLGDTSHFNRWGSVGEELAALICQHNGFYAFESALLLRPLDNDQARLGVLQWNQPELWKREFTAELDDALFFAEDIFGPQFAIHDEGICSFDPETGLFEAMATSLERWASEILSDYEFQTGYPFAHEWQMQHGPLPPGIRLLPKKLFVVGGDFTLDNLYAIEDVEGMRFRASIANQIRDLPDGTKIVFNVNWGEPPQE